MLKPTLFLSLLIPAVFISQAASAAPVTCTTGPGSEACVSAPGFVNAWVFPEDRNEAGFFLFVVNFGPGSTFISPDSPFPGAVSTPFVILESQSPQLQSDLIFVPTNRVPVTPNLVVEFLDGGDQPLTVNPPFTVAGTEDPVGGFAGLLPGVVAIQADGTQYDIWVASTGEAFFDPLGVGFNTSDAIAVCPVGSTGCPVSSRIAEPSSVAILSRPLLEWVCFAANSKAQGLENTTST
jgi:hypothetical protein